ncbi:ABC transporter ATP-binding protein [uncultured Marinobacter sp.]|uniref:ATP-binding cassette domain-containing protein n=1 Tax=uncultured Marinobacter sp. TaxID=187379 RepID=UPI002588E161|nr:ABC transporter ATP-binding protein [uncultured Marinobacter sp.]
MNPVPGLLDNGRKQQLAVVFVLVCAEGFAAGAAALATRGLFNALHSKAGLPTGLMALLAVSGLMVALCRVFARTSGEQMGQVYGLEIRKALFSQATFMAVSDVSSRRAGYMSLRFVGDLTAFRNWLGLGLPRLMAAFVLIPVALFVLGWMYLPFLWAIAPLYLGALLVIGIGGARLPEYQRRVRSRRAAIAADMTERMPIAPDLGHLGRRSSELRRIVSRTERMVLESVNRVHYAEWLKSVPDVISGVAALGVIWIGSSHDISTGTVAGGLSALVIALKPMRDLAGVWNHWSAFRTAHLKLIEALRRPTRRAGSGGKRLREGRPLSVRCEELNLSPLSNLSGSIRAGSRVLIKGGNGTGKSRLLRALSGLEKPESGNIKLDGKDIQQLSQGSLRRSVWRISDDVSILGASFRKNLTMGLDVRPSDSEIDDMVANVGLSRRLAVKGGLDGRSAEGGRDLSAGERVKIVLARAMFAHPGLVLIDSCVNQLDERGKQALINWLDDLQATVVVVEQANLPTIAYNSVLDLNEAAGTKSQT